MSVDYYMQQMAADQVRKERDELQYKIKIIRMMLETANQFLLSESVDAAKELIASALAQTE